jgi:SAM-dependent methyltransferase
MIVPLLSDLLGVRSVLDVGCGRGVWLDEWNRRGVADIAGVDGDYVDDATLAIPAHKFLRLDLSQPFDLNRRFGLVQSLEVGEHISAERADAFVANLARHGDVILFSAAVPGQGGEFHVNEQPYEYWRDKFASHGFRTFDWLRPRIRRQTVIEPWYRYNMFLFARSVALARTPAEFMATEIVHNQAVPSLAPLSWRLRNRALAHLPQTSVHRLAILKHKLLLMARAVTRMLPTRGLR